MFHQAVVDEMDVFSDEECIYLNQHTGKFVTIRNEEIDLIEREDNLDDCPQGQLNVIRKTQWRRKKQKSFS